MTGMVTQGLVIEWVAGDSWQEGRHELIQSFRKLAMLQNMAFQGNGAGEQAVFGTRRLDIRLEAFH